MPTRFEQLYLAVTLFTLVGGLAFFLGGQPQTESGIESVLAATEDGDIRKQIVLLALYGIGAVLLVLKTKRESSFSVSRSFCR